MIIINNTDNICSVCEKHFKHKRRGFKLLGDELKTIFFITCQRKLQNVNFGNLLLNKVFKRHLKKIEKILDSCDRAKSRDLINFRPQFHRNNNIYENFEIVYNRYRAFYGEFLDKHKQDISNECNMLKNYDEIIQNVLKSKNEVKFGNKKLKTRFAFFFLNNIIVVNLLKTDKNGLLKREILKR